MDRRLAAIVAGDVVGYSVRVERDEAATLRMLARVKEIVDRRVRSSGGRIFSLAGDGFLAEFASPVAAVRAAFEIQRDLNLVRREVPDMLELRVGVHVADVVVQGYDLLGDGVNVAARIEAVSEPGAVTISQTVFDQVKRTAGLTFEELGPVELKNLSGPIQLYRVLGELDNHSYSLGSEEISLVPAASSGDGETRPSVAVIPFVNLSREADQDHLADGFTEDIIIELSRFRTIGVASRNASLAYRDRSPRVSDVGRVLGVDYCLEGSVRRMGQRLRLSVQLSRADSEMSLWADRWDCDLTEIFDVQDEIASRVSATVAGRVETHRLDVAKRKRPAEHGAYECLLRGLEHHRLGGVTLEDARRAVEWFDKAIAIEPDYARAHAWRSCAKHTLGEWVHDDWWDDSLASVKRALELDENDSEAHRIMGVMCLHDRQWVKSRHHFERALEINPNHANVVARTGEVYNFMGEPEKALEMVERAKRLDPFLPNYCRELEIAAYYGKGDYVEAVRVADEMTRRTRRAAAYCAAASNHLSDLARREEARSELVRIDPDFNAERFVETEYYRDPAMRGQLVQDLSAAGLS